MKHLILLTISIIALAGCGPVADRGMVGKRHHYVTDGDGMFQISQQVGILLPYACRPEVITTDSEIWEYAGSRPWTDYRHVHTGTLKDGSGVTIQYRYESGLDNVANMDAAHSIPESPFSGDGHLTLKNIGAHAIWYSGDNYKGFMNGHEFDMRSE